MADLKDQLSFSKKEQIAFLLLLFLMLLLIGINFVPGIFITKRVLPKHQLEEILAQQDSALKMLKLTQENESFNPANPDESVIKERLKPFPFNPNNLPDSSWEKLGLAPHQIKNIKNYESSGGKFFRKEDLKKIYTISETEYKILEPFIVIPSYGNQRIARANQIQPEQTKIISNKSPEVKAEPEIVNINTADSLQLINLPQLGPWFSHRILKYRSILGGFADKSQLLEVYGMDKERYSAFESYIEIDTTNIEKLNINFADFKTVVRHPYFSYPFTKSVFNHRDRKGMIKDFEQLVALKPESDTLSPFLKYYIEF